MAANTVWKPARRPSHHAVVHLAELREVRLELFVCDVPLHHRAIVQNSVYAALKAAWVSKQAAAEHTQYNGLQHPRPAARGQHTHGCSSMGILNLCLTTQLALTD